MKHPFSALQWMKTSVHSHTMQSNLPESNGRYVSSNLIESTAYRQSTQKPDVVLLIVRKSLQHLQRFCRWVKLNRVGVDIPDPQRPLKVNEDKPILTVPIPRKDKVDIERRDRRPAPIALAQVNLALMLEVSTQATREEGRHEGLCGLGDDVAVEIAPAGSGFFVTHC